MPRLTNIGPHTLTVGVDEAVVHPGEDYDFTAAQVKAGIAGEWAEASKAAKKPKPADAQSQSPEPAVPADKEQPA